MSDQDKISPNNINTLLSRQNQNLRNERPFFSMLSTQSKSQLLLKKKLVSILKQSRVTKTEFLLTISIQYHADK